MLAIRPADDHWDLDLPLQPHVLTAELDVDDPDADDDLDPEELLDEPGEEALTSRPEPSEALKDEYERLHEAERQKEELEGELASRELQLEAAAARKVKAAAKERDEALQDV